MLNICYTLFNPKQETITKHLELWKSYGEDILKQLRFILIDDCSDTPVNITPDFNLNLKLVRITDDIYWNLPGARNLAFHLAEEDWCLSLDMDHFIPKNAIQEILDLNKQKQTVYRFRRLRDNKEHTIHRDSFLIHKEDFWKMGGYDEDMCGCRGANEDLIDATIKYNNYDIVNLNTTIINDETHGKVGGIKRDFTSPNYCKLRQKLYQMKLNTYKKTSHLRFKWEVIKELLI